MDILLEFTTFYCLLSVIQYQHVLSAQDNALFTFMRARIQPNICLCVLAFVEKLSWCTLHCCFWGVVATRGDILSIINYACLTMQQHTNTCKRVGAATVKFCDSKQILCVMHRSCDVSCQLWCYLPLADYTHTHTYTRSQNFQTDQGL